MMRAGLLLLYFCTFAAAHGGQLNARVIAVLDGDTVMVLRNSGRPVKVRLADIDAPEKEQPGGIASKKSLTELVLHKQVSMSTQATDIYGRLVAHLTVDGRSVNEEQLRRGMAWAAAGWRQSRRAPTGGVKSAQPKVGGGLPTFGVPLAGEYSNYHSNKTYIELQSEAQQAKRGLWAGAEIMEPAQWRKLHATEAPASPSHTISSALAAADYICGSKHHCSQMLSCDEAYFYLSHCGEKSLDRNEDGVPCKSLCDGW